MNKIFHSVFSFVVTACLTSTYVAFAADPRIEQGARFEAKGEFEKALGEYRSILAEDPKNSEAYFAAAEVRLKMKDYSGALANYRLAYKFEPKMSEAYEGAAKVYEALGQKAKADAERAKDPKNAPEPEPASEQVAAPDAPAADAPAASEPAPVAEPVKVAEPELPVAEPAKVADPPVVAKTEVKEEAKTVETKVEPAKEDSKTSAKEEPKVSDDPFEKGKALLAEGKFKEAAPMWREVLAKQPGHAGAYFYAGVTRYEMGEYDKAEFNLKKGLDYKERGNDAHYYLALVYQKTNRLNLEKKSLASYIKKSKPDAEFRKAVEDRLNEIKMAENPVEVESSAATESTPEVEKNDASETEKVASAKAASSSAKVSEKSSIAPNSIANANMLFKAGSIEAALQMYKGLLENELPPEERYFAMLQMGNIYREMRDFHSAVTRYREVVQQFPDSDWATEAERALEDAVWLEKHAADLPRKKR